MLFITYYEINTLKDKKKKNLGDLVYCANMKPNKLDSKFSLANHVIVETQASDTFSLVNVDTGTTPVHNAKYLKHAPSEHGLTDHTEQVDIEAKESYGPSESGCNNTEPSGHVDKQATQNDEVVTTRSRRVVKSTKDCENFAYY